VEPLRPRLSIGLTGGIGSGKSTVATMLVRLGAKLVDTDAISRRLTGPSGAAMPALVEAFGPTIAQLDGALDRAVMRDLAFEDTAARLRLESVLHPLIGSEALSEARAASARVIVFDVPLLAGSSVWRARMHRILVIDCSVSTQIERVMTRPGWARESAARVIGAQSSRSARRAIADALIFNDGIDVNTLRFEVEALWSVWNN
jgi:dephospho-CoA kinase